MEGLFESLGKEAQVGLRRTSTPLSADPKPEEKGEEAVGLANTPFFGLWGGGGGTRLMSEDLWNVDPLLTVAHV